MSKVSRAPGRPPGHAHLHPHHHHHSDPGAGAEQRRALRLALAITATFLLVQTVGAVLSGSLALLADSGHLLSDIGSLLLALLAMTMARRPPTAARTYGWHRAEVLAALVNGAGLVVIAVLIVVEAFQRFATPHPVRTGLMLGVAVLGLGANVAAAAILHRHHRRSLNVRGAYLHVVADCLGSVGVVAAALVMMATGWTAVDPLISIGIAVLVLWSSWGIIRDAGGVLLESTPPGIDLRAVKEALEEDDQVEGVHDLHVWTVTSGFMALSAHLVVRPAGTPGSGLLLERLQHLLDERFGIAHTTLQIEHGPHADHLRCLGDPRCLP
ncbi:MAG: cation diffusion facilitator family transporter [Actinomycetota bacterium]